MTDFDAGVKAEAARDKRDAARYRWLRDNEGWWEAHVISLNYDDMDHLMGAELDAAIDAAMGTPK